MKKNLQKLDVKLFSENPKNHYFVTDFKIIFGGTTPCSHIATYGSDTP